MEIKYGEGKTEYGPGVEINLTGDEIATAIDAYIVAHGVHYQGPRTITVNGNLCVTGRIYVDPSGLVSDGEGMKYSGRGEAFDACQPTPEETEDAYKFFGITEVRCDASSLIKVSDFVDVKYGTLVKCENYITCVDGCGGNEAPIVDLNNNPIGMFHIPQTAAMKMDHVVGGGAGPSGVAGGGGIMSNGILYGAGGPGSGGSCGGGGGWTPTEIIMLKMASGIGGSSNEAPSQPDIRKELKKYHP